MSGQQLRGWPTEGLVDDEIINKWLGVLKGGLFWGKEIVRMFQVLEVLLALVNEKNLNITYLNQRKSQPKETTIRV